MKLKGHTNRSEKLITYYLLNLCVYVYGTSILLWRKGQNQGCKVSKDPWSEICKGSVSANFLLSDFVVKYASSLKISFWNLQPAL